jgi:hypothetical protein
MMSDKSNPGSLFTMHRQIPSMVKMFLTVRQLRQKVSGCV